MSSSSSDSVDDPRWFFTLDDLHAFGALITAKYAVIDDTSALRLLLPVDDEGYGTSHGGKRATTLKAWRDRRDKAWPMGALDLARANRIIEDDIGDALGDVVRVVSLIYYACSPSVATPIHDHATRLEEVKHLVDVAGRTKLQWPRTIPPPADLETAREALVRVWSGVAAQAHNAGRLYAVLTGRARNRPGRPAATAPFWANQFLARAFPSSHHESYVLAAAIACRLRFERSALATVTTNYRTGAAKRRPIRLDRLTILYPPATTRY